MTLNKNIPYPDLKTVTGRHKYARCLLCDKLYLSFMSETMEKLLESGSRSWMVMKRAWKWNLPCLHMKARTGWVKARRLNHTSKKQITHHLSLVLQIPVRRCSGTHLTYSFQPLEHKGMSCGTLNNVGSFKIKSKVSNVLLARSF